MGLLGLIAIAAVAVITLFRNQDAMAVKAVPADSGNGVQYVLADGFDAGSTSIGVGGIVLIVLIFVFSGAVIWFAAVELVPGLQPGMVLVAPKLFALAALVLAVLTVIGTIKGVGAWSLVGWIVGVPALLWVYRRWFLRSAKRVETDIGSAPEGAREAVIVETQAQANTSRRNTF